MSQWRFNRGPTSAEQPSVPKNVSHEYKSRLVGLLPYKHKHSEKSGAWDLSNVRLVKKPSDYSAHLTSQLETAGHAALIGSAIVERRFGMSGFMNLVSDTSLSDDDKDKDKDKERKTNPDSPIPNESEESLPTDKEESEKAGEPEKNETELTDDEFNSGFTVTNFYKNCFQPGSERWEKVPDFVCERLALIFLSSETDPFALQAQKVKFRPKNCPDPDAEYETIEIIFPVDSIKPLIDVVARTGPSFVKWATAEKTGSKQTTNENSGEDENYFPYNHGYIEGTLTRHYQSGLPSTGNSPVSGSPGIPPLTNSNSRSFTVGMMAAIGGVWKFEEDPKDYTCEHLAEMRTAQESTVTPFAPWGERNSFYKQVRMKRNWVQARLAGEKFYLVGINGPLPEKPLARVIKELWLMEVDRIPRAIQISAVDENFVPWSPEDIFEKLFDALEVIQQTVNSKKGTPEEFNRFTFMKYPRDSDHLIYDESGQLFEQFAEAKRTVILRNLPSSIPNPVNPANPPNSNNSTENSSQTIISSPPSPCGSEEFYSKLQDYISTTIFKYIRWPKTFPLPRVKREGEGRFWDLQLRFVDAELASVFLEILRGFWGKSTTLLKRVAVDIPKGFERMRADPLQIRLPRDHPMARRGNFHRTAGCGHFRSNSDPFFYRPPHARHARRESSGGEMNGNWRK